MMGDEFTPYEIGLTRLLEKLGEEHRRYIEALTFQSRLLNNIAKAREYGDALQLQHDRAQIVKALNQLAQEELRISFNKLCEEAPNQRERTSTLAGCTARVSSWILKAEVVIVAAVLLVIVGLCSTVGRSVIEQWLPAEPLTPPAAPTPTDTLTPMSTPKPTNTPTFTPMPILTPTIVPTPTPDCRDVQVSHLELVLVDESGQQTSQRYPGQNEIVIERFQIDRLENLLGRAMLTGANVENCTCYWEGQTNVTDLWGPINSPARDCGFSIGLPDEVTAIYLRLTVGGRMRLFTIRIR